MSEHETTIEPVVPIEMPTVVEVRENAKVTESVEAVTPESAQATAEQSVTDRAADTLARLDEMERDCDAAGTPEAKALASDLRALGDEAKGLALEALLRLRECVRKPPADAEAIREMFEANGVAARVVDVPGGVEFQRAIILSKNRASTEPLVRVYRGVHRMDETLLRQVPYALRSRDARELGPVRILEGAREQALALADRPTHENLMRYVDVVWPELHDTEIERFNESLEDIENYVLEGQSLRINLAHKTFGFAGGAYADTGIPPYLSASGDLSEAAAYGRAGIMVLDVPVSKIEALFGRAKGEVVIKGEIDPSHITAILPRGYSSPDWKTEDVSADAGRAVDAVVREARVPVLSEEEAAKSFREISLADRAEDRANHGADVLSIQTRRAELVRQRFGFLGISKEDVKALMRDESVDAYTAAKRAAYDRLADRFEKADPRRNRKSALEERYVFEEKFDMDTLATARFHYVRANVSDGMLAKLRKLVEHHERLAR